MSAASPARGVVACSSGRPQGCTVDSSSDAMTIVYNDETIAVGEALGDLILREEECATCCPGAMLLLITTRDHRTSDAALALAPVLKS